MLLFFAPSSRPVAWQLALNPLAIALWTCDFVLGVFLWLVSFGPAKYLANALRSRQFSKRSSDGTLARHRAGLARLATSPHADCATVVELMRRTFAEHGPLKALGTREYLGAHIPSFGRGKRPVKIFGETTWKTYDDLDADANAFGRGLRALGVEPLPLEKSQACTEGFEQLVGPHCCVIYEETCAEWTTAALGCMANSIPIATSYATLGMAALAEVVNECHARVVVCNYRNVAKVASLAPLCPTLRVVVYTRHHVDPAAPPLNETTGAGADKLVVLSFGDVVAKGAAASLLELPLKFDPTPNHLAVIMYTSGTTGKPKGVMVCHSALVAALAAFCDFFTALPNLSFPNERYLAYLPLAHILEFCFELGILVLGASIGYADPATLTCKGAIRKLPDGQSNHKDDGPFPAGALREFAPTVMSGVPKVWDMMMKSCEAAVGKANRPSRALFSAAFAGRNAALVHGRPSPLCSALLSKSRQVLGGRLKLAISGGGPISADVQSFVRVAFNVALVQGYGLTETAACGTIQDPASIEGSVVGGPVSSVEICLSSCIGELGAAHVLDSEGKPYLSTDTTHLGTRCLGRGEIMIRGPAVSSGYYMNAKKSAEDFDRDGWFHTGDIGVWTTDGQLRIVDRLKNLVKLKGGEYVALEFMEATYSQSVFVHGANGGIMCYADGEMDRPVALLQVNGTELKKWADSEGVRYESLGDLCKNKTAVAMVTNHLRAIGEGRLARNELLWSVALLPGTGDEILTEGKERRAQDEEILSAVGVAKIVIGSGSPWSTENGLLTASNKLNRKLIAESFKAELVEAKIGHRPVAERSAKR